MAINRERGRAVLTGRAAKSFAQKMKSPNPEVMQKRDAYFKTIRDTLDVSTDEKGNVILNSK